MVLGNQIAGLNPDSEFRMLLPWQPRGLRSILPCAGGWEGQNEPTEKETEAYSGCLSWSTKVPVRKPGGTCVCCPLLVLGAQRPPQSHP